MTTTSTCLTVVTESSRFLSLEEPWNALVARLPQPSVFLRHEWFRAAWAWRASECQLRILCVYVGTELVGICPLVLRQHRKGPIPLRTLEFLAVPDTQFCDLLVDARYLDPVLQCVLTWLQAEQRCWDCLELSYLRSDSPVLRALQSLLAATRLRYTVAPSGSNPFVECTSPWPDFYATRSRRLKKANNHVANKLAKAGHIEVLWLRATSERPLHETLEQIIDLSANSWKRSTGLTLNNPGPSRFIRTLTELAAKNGWFSAWFLLLDGKAVAMEYQLIYDECVHALRADYLSSHESLSPGSFLNWKLLQGLFESGLTRYYMGPGSNPYKARWAEAGVDLCRLHAYSRNLRGRALGRYQLVLRPAAQALRQRLQQRLGDAK